MVELLRFVVATVEHTGLGVPHQITESGRAGQNHPLPAWKTGKSVSKDRLVLVQTMGSTLQHASGIWVWVRSELLLKAS